MKKLLLIIALLAAASVQAQEQEVFDRATAELSARRDSVYAEYLTLVRNKTRTDVEQAKIDSLENLYTEIAVEISAKSVSIMESLGAPYSDAFVGELNNTSLMIFADHKHYGHLQTRAEGLFAKLSTEQQNSPEGYKIKLYLFPFPAAKVGDQMPNPSLKDLNGVMHTLREEQNGKWLLVDFWSVGCGPCIESFPETHELLASNPDLLAVVGINIDGAKYHEYWQQASEEYNITWLNIGTELNTEFLNRMRVNGIPDYVLVAPDGTIADHWWGYGEGYMRHKLSEHIKDLK